MASLSPMMKQYFEMKKKYPDTILFFRLGDFYEMFYDDAKLVSRELDLTLTGRDCGQEERAPMCGVPFHSYETYLARLVAKGYKVAICEQMEDPALAKGLVKRDIIRVVTPGTVLESSMLDESRNNYISSVCVRGETAGVCFADISTGELYATSLHKNLEEQLQNELSRYSPSEILVNQAVLDFKKLPKFIHDRLCASVELLDEADFEQSEAEKKVLQQFQKDSLEQLQLDDKPELTSALGALFAYLKQTERTGVERIAAIQMYSGAQYMRLDLNTRRNLELTETMRSGEKRGSLLWVLDKTHTPMGKRLIRSWILQPLLSPAAISRRLNAVEELTEDSVLRDTIAEQLSGVHDLERVMSRVVYGSANGRELRALEGTARRLPPLRTALKNVQSQLLCKILEDMDPLDDIADLVDRAIVEEPPFSLREGGIIRSGFSEELDLLKGDMSSGRGVLAQIETREREKTGISKLKVGYNRVFGYYIEVPNAFKEKVPETYIRKQTLTNCERYITPELKQLEGRILGAHDKSVQLEHQLFEQVRKQIAGEMDRVQRTAVAVAQLDVLLSFAQVSVGHQYTRPIVDMSGKLELKDSRHPVVEALLEAPFVPNDVTLDKDQNRVAIITGPNMAGKSTYMRQAALITIMAQIGCFVPAASARVGITDAIFTRVGASDDLAAGQSTFMLEMAEVADILKNATPDSLIILDEIGRGTSTYDGMSIARAVVEYVADKKTLGAKTLFATHYHELTALENLLDGVKNYNIACKKHGDDITFLRRIVRGGADESYGIEVAKLAGVPNKVIQRAKRILAELNRNAPADKKSVRKAKPQLAEESMQLTLTPPGEKEALERLRSMDVNTLTPIECMNQLFELSKLVKGEK
ncbi:DNA mismatch repair protein MutS [Caproicibacterium lactatifermentans]|jgi:DNA mismatch repair protein MutS|uniref:DNA mismatch repair protein MutS n=1 Tax=Caproicibacterium lactatifermentans TaxID=2666138 RepID=A0A859DQZ1_9FIRM|nr:DNA mismatch repair protein MutS [Caproicibacterium lactatifermentans]QKN24106.1 DNA mismatch repair protein MutS [Caproicibacterium lactatifermentans]